MRSVLLGVAAGLIVVAAGSSGAGQAPQSLDPLVLAPNNFKLEFENQHVRVIREHVSVGERVPMHEHKAGAVLVLLADQNMRQTLGDGTVRELRRKAGEAYWVEPATHSGQNIGDKPFDFIRIEVKATRP